MRTSAKYIIVGSGPGAVMAAQSLLEAGEDVLMLDAGVQSSFKETHPEKNYLDLRMEDKNQWKYFLGNHFESVPQPGIKTGAQLSPSRMHMIQDTQLWCPTISENFFPLESLSQGGLGTGWGLGSYVYSKSEIAKCGLDVKEMQNAYDIIHKRIGISAGNDVLKPYVLEHIKDHLPSLKSDDSIQQLLDKYQKKSKNFQKKGIYLGAASMALLSQDYQNRKASKYHDMDFYSNKGQSAWRSDFWVESLQKQHPSFSYLPNWYVTQFEENKDDVEVNAIQMDTKETQSFHAKKILLGAGALGSARIALRSLPIKSLPILCNPYTYMPLIHWKRIGKPLNKEKTSMAQAMMILDESGAHKNMTSVALYTYRSLLLMRLIQQSPLAMPESLKIMNWLQSAFVIAGIHHPDDGKGKRALTLIKDSNSFTGDALKIDFTYDPSTLKMVKTKEKTLKKALRKLGLFPISRLDPGPGSSIHYGGTLPINSSEKLGYSHPNGRIYGSRNAYTVDGSAFAYLPAKGITLSIMANAHRVANQLLNHE